MIETGNNIEERANGERMTGGQVSYNPYRSLFRSEVDVEEKKKILNTVVLPVMIYG